MRRCGSILAWIRPAGPVALLLLGSIASPAMAGSRTSANYTIPADTNDSGGRHTSSAAYANDGSVGNVAGSATVGTYAITSGFIAQLQPTGAAPVITSPLTASGTYNSPISTYTITATNSPTSYDATGLPDGLAVDPGTGAITGTPTAANPFNVTISATNANGTGSATLVFTIAKASQTITFAGPANQVFSPTPITLNASASSFLAVTFGVMSGPATVSGKFLTLTGPGIVVIRASQAGDSNYLAAPDVDRTLIVSPAAAKDFNGDGKSDIVWTNTATGARSIWLMNGTAFQAGAPLGTIPPEWKIAAVADFNGDGTPDLLWEDTVTGDHSIWLMNGTGFLAGGYLGTIPTAWKVAGTGDFNSDGKADIVWENTVTGDHSIWLMDGTAFLGGAYLGLIPTAWNVAAIGDFNGDGKSDLLWENTVTGDHSIWLMNGTSFLAGAYLGVIPLEWKVACIGDFNNDGRADLVWENTVTGDHAIWLMDGGTFLSGAYLGTLPTAWRIAGTADFNGDGKADLVWQNTVTGEYAIWLMNGTAFLAGGSLGVIGTDWLIAK